MIKQGLGKDKSCDGKEAFLSKAEASAAAVSHIVRYNTRIRLAAYKCKFCKWYHFGHTSMKKDIKRPNSPKRQVKKLNPRDFEAKGSRDLGYYIIRQNFN